MIEINHLVKSYNDNIILDDITLAIESKEIIGLIGKSGAGKSTLLRCINRLESFELGQIYIDGQDIQMLEKEELRLLRQNIGMIFQGFSLINRKSVYDNIALPMKLHGYSAQDIHKKVEYLADIVGIRDKLSEKPTNLSGGQKQRVAIARALTLDPQYLLCDECTSSLDPHNTTIILELLKKIRQQLGVTIIIVTHEMEIVRNVCDRVAILENKKIVSVANVSDLFLRQSDELGRFLGNQEKDTIHNGCHADVILNNTLDDNYFIYDIAKCLQEQFKIIGYYPLETNDGKFCKISLDISPKDIEALRQYATTHNIDLEIISGSYHAGKH